MKIGVIQQPRYRISASRYGKEFYDWTYATDEDRAYHHARYVESVGYLARIQKRHGKVYKKILYQTGEKYGTAIHKG